MSDCSLSDCTVRLLPVRSARLVASERVNVVLHELSLRWNVFRIQTVTFHQSVLAIAREIRQFQRRFEHFVPRCEVIPYVWHDPQNHS